MPSVNIQIVAYMRNLHQGGEEWIAGGRIEDYIRVVDGAKGSTVSKRLREMSGEGETYSEGNHVLDKKIENGFVWYRVRDMFTPPTPLTHPDSFKPQGFQRILQ